MAKKKQQNYLDYVPAISDKHTWSVEDGKVTIHMEHRGFYAWIAQKFFSRHIPSVRLGRVLGRSKIIIRITAEELKSATFKRALQFPESETMLSLVFVRASI